MSCSLSSGLDHDPGAQEEEGLEKGVGHEVKDGGGPRAHPQGQEHVADLAHGRIGEDALYVLLREGARPGDEEREAPIRATTNRTSGASMKSGCILAIR